MWYTFTGGPQKQTNIVDWIVDAHNQGRISSASLYYIQYSVYDNGAGIPHEDLLHK